MNMDDVALLTHQPCSACGSSDALSIYEDHTFCFSCSDHKFTNEKPGVMKEKLDWQPVKGTVKALKSRRITEDTCKKYGYTIGEHYGQPVQIATYRRDGKIVGQKIRTPDKQFRWVGEKKPPLYGQHLFKASGSTKLVITEGEIDCLTMSQVNDNRWPVVSLPNGAASAAKSIKNNLEFVNSFASVVLMFDMDEPGKKAMEDCAILIAPGKCHIAELPLKDPNEMLKAGRTKELLQAMWDARKYAPEGLVNGADLYEEMSRIDPTGDDYPWPSMTKALHGIRLQEIIVLIASTGIGKSQVLKEIAFELIQQQKKIGLFFMEESNKITALNLVGMSVGRPIHLPEHTITDEERREHFDKILGNGNVQLFNKFGAADIEDIKSKMRYMAVSCGTQYFFVDHMACFAISKDAIADERKTIDVVIASFAELVRELNVTMFLVSHINRNQSKSYDDGAEPNLNSIRSSAGLAQWASQIISLSRNSQAEDQAARNITKVRVLKDRFAGQVGETFSLLYDKNTGRISETDAKEEKPFKPITESEQEFDF